MTQPMEHKQIFDIIQGKAKPPMKFLRMFIDESVDGSRAIIDFVRKYVKCTDVYDILRIIIACITIDSLLMEEGFDQGFSWTFVMDEYNELFVDGQQKLDYMHNVLFRAKVKMVEFNKLKPLRNLQAAMDYNEKELELLETIVEREMCVFRVPSESLDAFMLLKKNTLVCQKHILNAFRIAEKKGDELELFNESMMSEMEFLMSFSEGNITKYSEIIKQKFEKFKSVYEDIGWKPKTENKDTI